MTTSNPNCPGCGNPLERVRQGPSEMLNDEQFDSLRAGDWVCETCPCNGRWQSGYCYWWDREVNHDDSDPGVQAKSDAVQAAKATLDQFKEDQKSTAEPSEIRITRVSVAPPGECIFGSKSTSIEIDDEGAGEFLRLKQHELTPELSTEREITLNPEEWPAIRIAIDQFIERGLRE